MTSRFKIYVQSAGPQFRHILKEELHSLLTSASPTVKPPKFSDIGTSGVEFNGTLRDIYVLSHGLRSADDMLVQIKQKNSIMSQNKFVQTIQSIPFHAFTQRFYPYAIKKGHKNEKQQAEEIKKRDFAERFTLPANIRVLVEKSTLTPDRQALKHLSHEAIRNMLIQKKKQTPKEKTQEYSTDVTINTTAENIIPPRPCINPVTPGATIRLIKNNLTVSISAAGQRVNMLYKRGWRNRIVETPLRESIAAGVLHAAYTDMKPMKQDNPLLKLNEPEFTKPIANTLSTLANSIVSLPPGFNVIDEITQRKQQIQATETNEIRSIQSNNKTADDETVVNLKQSRTLATTKRGIITEQQALRQPMLHSRDSTSISDVVAYTMSSMITRSDPLIRIFDPFCGSGTLIIEGTHKFLGLPPPPLPRSFAFEDWSIHNEAEYNRLIQHWNQTYEEVIQTYKSTFGITKSENKYTNEEEISLNNFPQFIGSDLREKAVSASTHNAKTARVGLFTQFYQSDFENIINQAGYEWNKYMNSKLSEQSDMHHTTTTSGMLQNKVTDAILLSEPPIGDSNILTFNDIFNPNHVTSIASYEKHQSKNLPLKFPYMKGYTLFSNIPWGLSDEKLSMMPDQRSEFNKGFVNTTQMESIDSLYMRLGRTLYRHSHLFRDVFILSAHAKFEKLTMIGAERAEKESSKFRSHLSNTTDVILRDNSSKSVSNFRWRKVDTFYNQGVKTHLLQLEM